MEHVSAFDTTPFPFATPLNVENLWVRGLQLGTAKNGAPWTLLGHSSLTSRAKCSSGQGLQKNWGLCLATILSGDSERKKWIQSLQIPWVVQKLGDIRRC